MKCRVVTTFFDGYQLHQAGKIIECDDPTNPHLAPLDGTKIARAPEPEDDGPTPAKKAVGWPKGKPRKPAPPGTSFSVEGKEPFTPLGQ